MAEGARLESVYTATYRGFESPPHRHIRDESSYESTGSFLLYSPLGGMRTPTGVRQLAQPVGQTAHAVSGLPRRGERSESIPPHRHIRDKSSYESTGSFLLYSPLGGMRAPDRGSTTGAASWTDRERSKRAAPQGRAKRVNPPLTAIFEMRARTKVRALFFYILRWGDENPRPGFDNWHSQLDRPRTQ